MPVPTDDQLAAAALRLEKRAERDVTADLAAAVNVVVKLIGRALLAGELSEGDRERLRAHIVAQLQAIRPDMAGALSDYLDQSLTLGVKQGLATLPRELRQRRPLVPSTTPTRELVTIVGNLDRKAADRLQVSVTLAASMPINPDNLRLVQGNAWRALNDSQSAVRWVTNRGVSLGTTRVAEQRGIGTIWIPERDACHDCLAYAGQVAKAGGSFPEGLTFGDKPRHDGPVPAPPLHPNCRCRVKPYDGPGPDPEVSQPNATLADALAKEAQRSIARGFSNYASQPAKLRAVERLLASGPALPKTVVQRAQRDLERGQFSGRHSESRVPAAR